MEQHLGLRNLFKRGAKAGYERVRQIADETYGIREQNAAAAGQLNGSQFWIERGEHARRRKHLRTGDRVEERAFACVGVTDECDGGHGNGLAALALLAADASDRFKIALELIDAALNASAIGFELGFAGPASADAAAELRHGFAAASEARQHVFELGQLHLELALARARVAGKNVEDELGAVEDAAGESRFKVAQLRGRKIAIEDNEIGAGGSNDGGDLFDFSGADESGGIGARAALNELGDGLAACAQEQLTKLGERFFGVEAARNR